EPPGHRCAVHDLGGFAVGELGTLGDVGGAADLGFVPGDEYAVGGGDEVGLDVVGAHARRQFVGGERVFGAVTRCASVSDDEDVLPRVRGTAASGGLDFREALIACGVCRCSGGDAEHDEAAHGQQRQFPPHGLPSSLLSVPPTLVGLHDVTATWRCPEGDIPVNGGQSVRLTLCSCASWLSVPEPVNMLLSSPRPTIRR